MGGWSNGSLHDEEIELGNVGRMPCGGGCDMRCRVEHLSRPLFEVLLTDADAAGHLDSLVEGASEDAVLHLARIPPARAPRQLLMVAVISTGAADLLDELEKGHRPRGGRGRGLRCLSLSCPPLGPLEKLDDIVLVNGGLCQTLGDDGRLSPLEAEHELDERMQQAGEQAAEQVAAVNIVLGEQMLGHDGLPAAVLNLSLEVAQEVAVVLA